MKCPRCQQDAPPSAAFCPQCGAKLSIGCPHCRAANAPGHTFCQQCGHRLGAPSTAPGADRFASLERYIPKHLAEKILVSKRALEGERKQVTVLFADLKSSMELLADRDPEEARMLLDPVLELMMDAVHRYEGTVNQVMGDGIMALFGAPVAHEDHAVRACYAALRMQESIKQHAEEAFRAHGITVQIRVGLNSGEVVVRAIGSDLRMDYTAVGQTVHLAARMEQLTPPGTILLTRETLQLAEGYVEVRDRGPVPVKGLTHPVAVYELSGASPVRSRLQALAARGLTKFVGRAPEIEQLTQALGRARAGHGQVVAIVAEAGAGKSRLCWEFTHSHRTQDWLILESSSVSYGRATPYLPVIDLLKSYFQIEARDAPRKIREKVMGKLLSLDRALEPWTPALLWLLGVASDDASWERLDAPHRRTRTLDGVKRLLLRESQVQPVVLVFDDLHWIDSESQTLLDGLVESLPTARLLLLVTYRPEYRHGWSGKTFYRQVPLGALSGESADELLAALLGQDASLGSLKPLLIERTGANPFFLEESVRTLVETGVLTGERGAYRLEGPLESIQVPPTIQTILAARIDRLAPEDKQLLQTAAVIGKDVPLVLLQVLAEESEEGLRHALTRLQAAEFLYEARLFPDHEYTFKHSLTHEGVYGSLLHDRRRALHAAIASAIEHVYPERSGEQGDQLAHHAVRGEVWDRAAQYCRQAGERAFARSAHRQAVAWFEQALQALQHLPESQSTMEQAIDLRLSLRYALVPLGEFERLFDRLREADGLARALGDRARQGLISAYLTNYCHLLGDLDRAVEYGRRAVEIGESLQDDVIRNVAQAYLGQAYHTLGQYDRAIELARKNIAALTGDLINERFGMALLPSVYSRSLLVWSLAEIGDFAEGIAIGEEGLRIAEAVNHPYSLVFAHIGIGRVHLRKGDVDRAVSTMEQGLRLCQSAEVPVLFSMVAAPLGSAYVLAGRVADGLSLLERAVETATGMGFTVIRSMMTTSLAEANLKAGRTEAALALARTAVEASQKLGARGSEAWARRQLGDILAQQEAPGWDEAERAYRQALAIGGELGMRPLLARGHLGLALLQLRMGRRDAATLELETAISSLRALGMTLWLRQAEDLRLERPETS